MKLFLVQNWHVPYFLYYLFTFNNRSTARIVSILCTCFHIKFFFQTLYDMYRTRTFFQNYSNFSQVSIVKNVNTTLVNINYILVFIFLQKRSYKACRPTESKPMSKCKWHGSMHQLENVQRRKSFKGYRNKLQNQITN